MKKLYKYKITLNNEQVLNLPVNTEFLSVLNQRNDFVIYAIVDLDSDMNDRRIIIKETGSNIENDFLHYFAFLGTVKTNNGIFIGHVFYEKKENEK